MQLGRRRFPFETLWPRTLSLRLRPPRHLKFTREGKFFVGITLGVGFAAINTANNLLYLVLGMLLALIVVSGVMSELSLRDLTVTRRLPPRAQVGRAHLVEIEVRNQKSRSASYAIEVEDLRAGQPADKRCFFLKISPNSSQVAAYRRTPTQRGPDLHTGFRIATRFPFGLFEKSRLVDATGTLLVYPAVDPIVLPPTRGGTPAGSLLTTVRGSGEDFLGLTLARPGDDPRDIHWRKSAALGQRVKRERARDARPDVTLTVDTARHPSADYNWESAFERHIRDVASHAVAHLRRGDRVALVATTGGGVSADRNMGADPLLRYLALLKPVLAQDAASFPLVAR
ncbi:MAG: DUF58 domain-containing protein [Polyangiaceae bacterium]